MKQKYICKCGKTFEKDGNSDTTGYRLGSDFSVNHECYGCHFVVPIEVGYPNPKIIDYECRASKKINYKTTADIPRDRASFHVAHVCTLDMNFVREIFEYTRKLDGLDDSRKEMDLRGTLYRSDGRYDLGLYFTKTKAGIASSIAVSDKFFAGGTERPGMTAEQEEKIVLLQIEESKKKAKSPVAMAAPGNAAVSNGVQNQRSIDQITVEINFYKQQTAQNIIEIGKRLIEAKQQLQHGEWLPWLRDKVDFSENSAQRFMRIAKEFSNPSALTDLPYTKLLSLLQVPEEERDVFLKETHLVDGQEKSVSEMSSRELQQAIKERDEAERAKRTAEQALVKVRGEVQSYKGESRKNYDNYMNALVNLEKTQENLSQIRKSREWDVQHIEKLEKQIKELESRPVDVAVIEPSADDKQQLRDEGEENARKEMQKELENLYYQLEEAKQAACNNAGLERDDIVLAAASFQDSMDSNFDTFKLILRIAPTELIEPAVRQCVAHLKGIISKLDDSVAEMKNISLMDQNFELPPEDGMEE